MTSAADFQKILAGKNSIEALGIPSTIVIDLIYKMLFQEGDVSVGRFVEVLRIQQQIIDKVLSWMQGERHVEIAKAGSLGRMTYTYRLLDEGMKRAQGALERNQYIGPVPVNITEYQQAILYQTENLQNTKITPQQVKQGLSHLILPDYFHRRIGPAVNQGSSIFLYGPPGNGKTTVAQSIGMLLAGTEAIRLPYAVAVSGQIVKVHDPLVHVEHGGEGVDSSAMIQTDMRWGSFHRPVVMVGGELVMDALDLRFDPITKFYEAPLQMKANGGMFLIDDFGRQQMAPQELLNRWIVPLESRIDFFRLQTGQSFEIPFRQLIVFSTNLDPKDLVDDAFLRRIQMKVEVGPPDERMFYQIFIIMCKSLNIEFDRASFVHFVEKWYRQTKRPLQSVHPRDILKIVVALSEYEGVPPKLSPAIIDEACESYFVKMD